MKINFLTGGIPQVVIKVELIPENDDERESLHNLLNSEEMKAKHTHTIKVEQRKESSRN